MKKLWLKYLLCFVLCFSIVLIMQHPSVERYLGITINIQTISAISSIFLSAILISVTYHIGKRQNDLQKANIKLALYEKRFKVYQAIIRTKSLHECDFYLSKRLQRKDSKETITVVSQMYNIRDELYQSSVMAHTIFPQELAKKIEETYKRFDEVIIEHLDIVEEDTVVIENSSETELAKILHLTKELRDVTPQTFDICKHLPLMQDFLNIFDVTNDRYKKRTEYYNWLIESKVLEEILAYIEIDELDK